MLEYIKHNRPVTIDAIEKYGKVADHDIRVPCLLLYELAKVPDVHPAMKDGKIPDANGTMVEVGKDLILHTLKKTNNWILNKSRNPFAKLISQWNKPIDEIRSIVVTKDHNLNEVDNVVGHTEGLLYTDVLFSDELQKDILALYVKVVIEDVEGKKAVENGLLRQTSIGTLPSGELREISFVSREAAPLCGLMFSESEVQKDNNIQLETVGMHAESKPKRKSKKAIQLAEEIQGLKLAEQELSEIIIPNHIILSKMIRSGKIYPFMYNELIKTPDRHTLQLMEKALPSQDLGLVFGTQKQPDRVRAEEFKFEEMIKGAQKRLGIEKDKDKSKHFEMIRQEFNSKESRSKELKHILELAESSPTYAKEYIKCELGEEFKEPVFKDSYLQEYMTQLSEIRDNIHNKSIQLGEPNE